MLRSCLWLPAALRHLAAARPRRQLSTVRPRLEALEDRAVPATLTVNSLDDGPVNLTDNVITLRDAIDAANRNVAAAPGGIAGSGADTITFAPELLLNRVAVRVRVTQGQFALTDPAATTIVNPDPGKLIALTSDGASRLFDVRAGASASFVGLTLSSSQAPSGENGGAIRNEGTLTLTNCFLGGNGATVGGAIDNNNGNLTALGCTFQGNNATSGAGAIGIGTAGVVQLINSTFANNSTGAAAARCVPLPR